MKKIDFRRMPAVLMCLALVLCLGGCGNNDTASTDNDVAQLIEFGDDENTSATNTAGDGNTATTGSGTGGNKVSVPSGGTADFGGKEVTSKVELSAADPFANIPKRLKGSTVKFATWGDETGDSYKKVINAFTERTGIKVEIMEYTQSQYTSSIATQVINKSSPDVVVTSMLPAMLQVLQPLQNIIDLDDPFWDQQIIEYGTYYGNSYIINSWEGPWCGVQAVYYNKDVFENNGLKTPLDYYKENNWTYETFIECAKSVKGYIDTACAIQPYVFNEQLGISVFDLNKSTHKYTNNITKAAPGYQFSTSLIDQKLSKGSAWFASLANNELAMYNTDLYGSKYNGYFANMKDSSLAMVPLPSSYQGKKLNRAVGDSRSYGICKGAKNPEGAAYFLRWFLDYDNYEDANADIFKNESVKNMYFNEIVPIYKNNKERRVIVLGDILWSMNGYKYEELVDYRIYETGSSNIQTVLDGAKNKFDDSAKKANEILDGLK